MEHDSTVYVGLDVHKESITVAYAVGMGEVELLGKIGTSKADIDRLCKRLQSKATHVRVVYEAGPCGYGLYRQLVAEGIRLHGMRAVADPEETRRARQDRPPRRDQTRARRCAQATCQRSTYQVLKMRHSGTWPAHGPPPKRISSRRASD